MTLEQETFLDASIRGFNASMGWGNQPSVLNVDLVEDPLNGDSFNPPRVGTGVIFSYSGWQFSGILQGYKRQYGQQGNPVYSVQVQDPRELLAGVQLILNDYTGTTGGVPNLYNIYGYLESLYGFGGSQVNEAGIPWYLVRDAFYNLQLTTPIYFRGAYYLFDCFYGANLLPEDYRLPGDSMSALEYVEHICEMISCDFAIEMIPLDNDETPATNAIKVRVISRNLPLGNNVINQFVDSIDGAVAKEAGYELNNEITSRFVVGGKLNNMYFQNRETYNTDSQYDDTVLPYWGYDEYDRLIIGTGDFHGDTGKEYKFHLDGRPLYLQTGRTSLIHYKTDLAEMHAALGGQESWESFLAFHNNKPDSIHYHKANRIGIVEGQLSEELLVWLSEAKAGTRSLPERSALTSVSVSTKTLKKQNVWNEETKKQIAKVYNYIKTYASEYYGKKFMVRIPFVTGAWVPETSIIRLSMLPTQTGYVPEEYWGNAIYLGYMPYNAEKFTDANNKLYPYAAFAGMTDVDESDIRSQFAFDKLSPNSFILDQYENLKLGKMRENLFVKGKVDENLVFINKNTLFSPRAVITLDGPIPDNIRNSGLENTALLNELSIWLKEDPTVLTDEDVDDWVQSFGTIAGGDVNWRKKEANYQIPDMCAVPLESQTERYGPWYISNTAGKVEFENDSSLVPWNFGNFTTMNNAGWAKVTSALLSQQVYEQGSVEFPGVPSLSLGRALLGSGPIVTDVNVSIGEDGVTTTYRMATWTWQFGRLGKYNVDKFARISKLAQQQRKAFRKLYGYQQPLTLHGLRDYGDGSKNKEPSVMILSGEMRTETNDGSKEVRPNVAMQTGRTFQKTLDDDNYANKAGVGIDGIFVPYTTKVDNTTDLAKFETPTASASSPNINDLNPFGGNSISRVFQDTTEINLEDSSDQVKSIALRSPVILAGWGYNTGGTRVPAGDNYKTRADQWKVGPLDVRWDNDRKVWTGNTGITTTSTVGIGLFELSEGIVSGGHGGAKRYTVQVDTVAETTPTGFVATSGSYVLYDWMMRSGQQHYAGDKVIASLITFQPSGEYAGHNPDSFSVWIINNAQCPC